MGWNAIVREAFSQHTRYEWSDVIPPSHNIRGGQIIYPKKGLFGFNTGFDFKSLYPSVIIACNISPESLTASVHENLGYVDQSWHHSIVQHGDNSFLSVNCRELIASHSHSLVLHFQYNSLRVRI